MILPRKSQNGSHENGESPKALHVMVLTAQETSLSSVEVLQILALELFLEGDQRLQNVAHQLQHLLTRNYSSLTPPLLSWSQSLRKVQIPNQRAPKVQQTDFYYLLMCRS
jgi:hypothetical protein